MKGWVLALILTGPAAAQNVASVSGTVLGANGLPLRKSSVALMPMQPGNPPASVITDGGGRFTISGVEPGIYRMEAEHTGYLHAVKTLRLGAGEELRDVAIRLTGQAVITGTVVDEDGDPVARAQVRAMRRNYVNGRRQLGQAGAAVVNDIGEFRIYGLAPGEYYLAAEAVRAVQPGRGAGPQPVVTYYPQAKDVLSAVPLRIRAGESLGPETIQIQTAEVFHVRGMVSGTTLPSAVTLRPHGESGLGAIVGQVARDGRFDVAGVPEGAWTVEVLQGQVAAVRAIEVAGQDVDGVELNATARGEIKGLVSFAAPAPQVRVGLQSVESGIPAPPYAQVGADGAFTLQSPGPGKFRVEVMGIPAGSYLKSVKVDGRDVMASGWEVVEGVTAMKMEVEIGSSAAEVTGVVPGPDGKPAPDSVVTIAPEPFNAELVQQFQRVNADQQGRFSFRGLAPGSYRVYAWDQLEAGEEFDPDWLQAHEDRGVSVTLSEGDHTLVTPTEIVQ